MKKINQIEPWIGDEEKRAMIEYLDSGDWLTEFKQTRKFEQMICEYVGSKYCSVVNNGTVSLTLACMALGLKEGDEVIVPDFTMIASANSVLLGGARPVLVDIGRENLCLDLELAQEAITPKTKAVVFVSLNGRCPDMNEVVSFAKKNDLFLIEDAAQSLGSRYKSQHLGTFGNVGSFSFSSPKIITTGQGGAIVTDNKSLYEKVSMIKNFGRAQSGVDKHEILGYNFKFTDLQAVIGIEQMKKLDFRVRRKKEIYRLYRKLLSDIEIIKFIDTNLEDTAPWFIDILVEKDRDSLAKFLKKEGIGTRPFYFPVHTQAPYKITNGNYENSIYVSQRGLWLPSSSFLSDEDIVYICNKIKDWYRNGGN